MNYMYLSFFVIMCFVNESVNESQFLKSMHNCVHFLHFLFPMHFSVICKAYSILNVLIAVINDRVFNYTECTEIDDLKMKMIKG